MKWISLLFLMTSCASHHSQKQMPPFNKLNVCSDHSLKYLKEKSKRPFSKHSKNMSEKIYQKTIKLYPGVKNCYQQELNRTKEKPAPFNLCLVVGFTNRGNMDFFEFSTKEYKMSHEFQACLANLQTTKELSGIIDVEIVQAFKMTPLF